MISVTEALAIIGQHTRDFGIEEVSLLSSAGRVLAAAVTADRDFPPFHRVTMDGVAINSRSFAAGIREFKIEQVQPAGHPQLTLQDAYNCLEVMTGAVLPAGTDAVIPYEECTLENGTATVLSADVNENQHVHLKGTDCRSGAVIINPGQRITPATIGILASVGKDRVPVKCLPRIAVCATGDELIPVTETPLPHQLRRSNSYMLAAALQEEGITTDQYYLPDDREQMTEQLRSVLQQYDAVLFSGAVSKGKYDFLPEVLAGLNMKTLFHRVAQKPGKPFLFGETEHKTLIFGFPGNPVSSLVCYKVFFQSWLCQSIGYQQSVLSAALAVPVHFKPSLAYHLLVTLSFNDGMLRATPCPGANSGDMISLETADAILLLPPDKEHFEAGSIYPAVLLSRFFNLPVIL